MAITLASLTTDTSASASKSTLADNYVRLIESSLRAQLDADNFISPTHRFDRELVLAHLLLHEGRELDWANAYLADFELDDQLRDWGDDEPDTPDWNFTGIKLLRLFKDFEKDPILKPEAQHRLITLLSTFPQPRVRHNRDNDRRAVWPGIHTENHDLILLTIGYFRAQLNGEDLKPYEQHLARSLAWRIRFGWLEANSPTYQARYVEPLGVLVDHAPNEAIREGASNALNHILSERAMFSVQSQLAGPQARTRGRPYEPSRDRMLPHLHLWFGWALPADFIAEPYHDAYWLLRSDFTPDPAVVALQAQRQSPQAPTRFYRGMRTRRGGEYTEFRYLFSPHVAMGSQDWRGSTRRHRYHNALLAHPRGEPVAVWAIYQPEDGSGDPRFGANESVQWGAVLIVRGEVDFTEGAADEQIDSWRVIHTPWAATAIHELPNKWKLLVAIDLKREGIDLTHAIKELAPPAWNEPNSIQWISRDGMPIRFDLRTEWKHHDVYLDGVRVHRPHGMLHDSPKLSSWYGTGIIDIVPTKGPSRRLTTEPLNELLR